MPLHFCAPCIGEDTPTLPHHVCLGRCKLYDECEKVCECGGEHVQDFEEGDDLLVICLTCGNFYWLDYEPPTCDESMTDTPHEYDLLTKKRPA